MSAAMLFFFTVCKFLCRSYGALGISLLSVYKRFVPTGLGRLLRSPDKSGSLAMTLHFLRWLVEIIKSSSGKFPAECVIHKLYYIKTIVFNSVGADCL